MVVMGERAEMLSSPVNPALSSLIRFRKHIHFRAEDGKHGGGKTMTGGSGNNCTLEVPPGTIIRDEASGGILADLTDVGREALILKGGRGGRGNRRFRSSTNQAPRLAERGEPGKEAWILLELKLIADVGLVGVPNAGKSTLLSVVSSARPKIADYPFTTLQPNLGVVELDEYETFVMADIPGLIEGAAAGAGLGHSFLRHIERTRILIHLLDGNSNDPLEDWAMINQEWHLYDARLEDKPQIVVLNKIDLPEALSWQPLIEEKVPEAGIPFQVISALTREGLRIMLYRVKQMLDDLPESEPQIEEISVIRPEPDESSFTITRLEDGWRVEGSPNRACRGNDLLGV